MLKPPTPFTQHQKEAIEWRSQDACVVAGPGSGKTTVLVERYRSLITDFSFKPAEILAITFTEKAAANMKAKVAEQFANDGPMLRELEASWISTIHGFCARILKENAIAAGIDPRFQVLDARESEDLQLSCLNAALDQMTARRRSETLELIEALKNPRLTGDLKSAYDAICSAGKSIAAVRAIPSPVPALTRREMASMLRQYLAAWPQKRSAVQQTQYADLLGWSDRIENAPDLASCAFESMINLQRVPPDCKPPLKDFRDTIRSWAIDQSIAPFRAMVFDTLDRFEELYHDRKTTTGALDFNDLESRTVALLRTKPEIRERIQKQFRQIMLDEFQDINEQQAELIRLVRADDVFFAVGDINQSIYGFRHASPDIFRNYRTEVAAQGKHSTELLHNFRSRDEILRCVEHVLNQQPGIEPRELVAGAEFPFKEAPCVEILRIQAPEGDDPDEEPDTREARWIAWRILSLHGKLELKKGNKAAFKDFAVLCRTRSSMAPILAEFDARRIPYVCGGRQSFLVSRDGLDLTALLQVIANPRDSIALATVLRSRLVGLSDESLLRLRVIGQSIHGALNQLRRNAADLSSFDATEAAKIESFIQNLARWRSEESVFPLDLVIVRALSDCGFENWTEIEGFLHLARTRGNKLPLHGFLDEIESLKKALNTESELSDEDQGNCVQVITAHGAKGLEFPVTIIASMGKGTAMGGPSISFTPEHGLGITWSQPTDKSKAIPDSWQARNQEYLKDREKQEANRLLYVAMTRAEEHLILSYSVDEKRKPSHWAKLVEQLDESDLPILRFNENGDPPVLRGDDDESSAETVLLPPPVIDDQHDTAVNVTSLAVFAACPRKYYLQRYIGWSGGRFRSFDPEDLPDDAPEAPAAEVGTLVHEILAGKPGSHPLADVFLNSPLGLKAAAATRSAREWDFIVDIDGTLVRGTIDLWFENNGEIHIVDYKTDDIRADEAAIRAGDYAPQLALYSIALERALGQRPAAAWLHFLRPDAVIEVPTAEAAVQRVHSLIGELKDAQNDLQFPLHEDSHCNSCPFHKGLCPAAWNVTPQMQY